MENPALFLAIFPLRFAIHLSSVLAIIALYYWKGNGSKEFSFSYVAIGVVIFSLCFLLEQVELELGFALGLFAIFGIIRYRTITMPIKEMTYLFVIIGISVINALAGESIGTPGLLLSNLSLTLILALLEIFIMKNHERSIILRYEKIENLKPGRKDALIADLKDRIGLTVIDFSIEEVDFLRDTANLRIYFLDPFPKREVNNVTFPTNNPTFDN